METIIQYQLLHIRLRFHLIEALKINVSKVIVRNGVNSLIFHIRSGFIDLGLELSILPSIPMPSTASVAYALALRLTSWNQ